MANWKPISFDRVAEDYDRTRWVPLNIMDEFIDQLIQEVPLTSGSRILEIGTGTGRLAIPLILRGYEVLGLDVSLLMLMKARQKFGQNKSRLHLLQADASNPPIREKTLDLCLFIHILHLVKDWKRVIDNAESLLRKHNLVSAKLFVAWHNLQPFRLYWDAIESRKSEHVGVKNLEEIIEYIQDSKGYNWNRLEFKRYAGKASWKDAIRLIQEKTFSSQWRIPIKQHQAAVEIVKRESEKNFGQVFELEAQCIIDLFKMDSDG